MHEFKTGKTFIDWCVINNNNTKCIAPNENIIIDHNMLEINLFNRPNTDTEIKLYDWSKYSHEILLNHILTIDWLEFVNLRL